MSKELDLMNYNIIGEFNSGLKVYLENKLVMYSKVSRKFFSDIIKVYDRKQNLILEVKQHSDYYEIIKINDKDFWDIIKINKDEIIFGENQVIDFRSKWFTISLYPKMKIYFKNEEIGFIRAKLFSLNINTDLYIKRFENDLVKYVLILLLCRFSSVDHG
ncbi:hypothetical protein [Tenacibaculum aiptasiae]|uniref:hypothetical protein n=1 Tax=Tenacibaculum aiptasiae TaxID=426481 RepID=UPI00232E2496|nr:hypothetical protein [Tenacibaculum aiptasiae]